MLRKLLEDGFGKSEKLNCAERILHGANEAYDLGLDKESIKLAAGFGGGMAVESACGALAGSVMVLSKLFVKGNAYNSDKITDLTKELMNRYKKEMGNIDCNPLKKDHRTLFSGCDKVIIKASEILDDIVIRETNIKK